MLDRDPLPAWGRGRLTLLGDAAHPMTPVGSNAGTQAIIDAVVLARELAAAPDPATALSRYEDARRGATTPIVLANREIDLAERAAARGARPDLAGELVGIADAYRRTTT